VTCSEVSYGEVLWDKSAMYIRVALHGGYLIVLLYCDYFIWWRPRRRWEDSIKMDLTEVGGGCGDWMEWAQDRDRWRALVSTVMNFRVPKMPGIS